MPVTLGLVATIYNEINALPAWLEMAQSFFDHVSVYHAGPKGEDSNDGTIQVLNKWNIPIHRGKIDDGFGICRSAALRSSPCDWVMLLDIDERFHQFAPVVNCEGESTPPGEVSQILQEYDHKGLACPSNWENVARLGAKLKTSMGEIYNQGAWLRSIIEHGNLDAVCTIRRHWHDFSWKKPTQNWHTDPDYQLRIVRNHPSIYFDSDIRMHEQLSGASNMYYPNQTHGPYFDHYHLFFKKLEPDQRQHDIRIYDAIHKHEAPPTWSEFSK